MDGYYYLWRESVGRAAVLLDGMYFQNILNAFDMFGKVDYESFSDLLAQPHQRARTYVFDALPYGQGVSRQHKQEFLDKLAYLNNFQVEMGYVKMERKKCPNCVDYVDFPRQKKVDILLATRLLECAYNNKIDQVVLVAGDGDFVPAVEIAKSNTEVVLAYAEVRDIGVSTELKKAADRRIKLDQSYLERCPLKAA